MNIVITYKGKIRIPISTITILVIIPIIFLALVFKFE